MLSESISVEFGVDASATNGNDPGLDVITELPPSPFDLLYLNIAFAGPNMVVFSKDIRQAGPWKCIVKSNDKFTLSWDISSVPADISLVMVLSDGRTIDMRAITSEMFDAGSYNMIIKERQVKFALTLNKDINLTAIPVEDERIHKVSDLATLLEDDWLLIISYDTATYKFQSFAPDTPETAMANVEIACDTGLIIVMKNESILMLQGNGWPVGDVQLNKGINMIGIPLKDPALKRVSDLGKLLGDAFSLIISFNTEAGKFQSFTSTTPPGTPADINIDGGVGLIVSMKQPKSFPVVGEPWERITPIPPITPPAREGTVIMDIHGSILEDGVRIAPDGLKVTVTNKTRSLSQSSKTGDAGDGRYSVVFLDIVGGIVASSGDEIEIIIADVAGKEVGKAIYTLTSTDIERCQAIIDVTTVRVTSVMSFEGSVFLKDGMTPAPDGLKVDVTNKTRHLSHSAKTGDAGPGRYSVTSIDLLGGIVAATGDEIEIVVTDVDGKEVGKAIYTLTSTDIEKQVAIIDVITTLGLSPGDVSGDGNITAYDASLVLQYVVGLIELLPDEQDAADVTGDGTVSVFDAALILQYTVGLITQFPVQGAPILTTK